MILYLMRHGNAPSAMDAGVKTDFDRPLSPRGREAARKGAAFIRARGGSPALILASPLVRAQQTAAEVAGALGPQPPVRVYAPLENQMSGMDLYRHLLQDDFPDPEVMLVGHQPQLGEAASFLAKEHLPMAPAGLAAFETDDAGKASLLWAADPSEY